MGKGKTRKKHSKGYIVRKIVLPIVGLVLGVALLMFPIVTDMYVTWKANQAISTMESHADYSQDPSRLEQLIQAQSYNAVIGEVEPELSYDDIWEYEQQLTWQTPYIGWIEIPKINVGLPVYHGTGNDVLANGAGHVMGSSLPVGGVPSNCVISAHSGLQTARMFDDVRKLEAGDKICIHTLSEPYEYEVVDSEIVLPEETEHLYIYDKDIDDMLTLVTCTPIGINDHRLLVHCKRIPYNKADFEKVPIEAYMNDRTVPPLLIGAAIAFASITGLLGGGAIWNRRRKKKGKKGTVQQNDADEGTSA